MQTSRFFDYPTEGGGSTADLVFLGSLSEEEWGTITRYTAAVRFSPGTC